MKDQNNTISEKDLRDDERLSAYMRGTMTKEEEDALMEDIKADKALRDRAIAMGYLTKALNDVGTERDNALKDALTTISAAEGKRIVAEATHKAELVLIRRKAVRILSVAATALVLCVAGYQYYDYRYTTGLAETYSSALPTERLYVRGSENETVTKELDALFAKVNEGNDMTSTIKRLSMLWELSTMETYNDYTDYMPLIGWNLAIAYLKDNDKADARTVLTKLVNMTPKGTLKHDKAKELLEKIK